jgi:predicted DCC family thiol-disulfide oxidoreductase YuxK
VVDTPVLIFDGDCGFCTTSVNFARRHIPIRAVVTPWQRTDLASLGVDRAQAEAAVLWVGRDGHVSAGPDAVAALLHDAGGKWRPVDAALAMKAARRVAWPVYRWVARNRHRFPGGTPACAVDSANRRTDARHSGKPYAE